MISDLYICHRGKDLILDPKPCPMPYIKEVYSRVKKKSKKEVVTKNIFDLNSRASLKFLTPTQDVAS